MYENNKEDILCSRIKYTMLSLISEKINVLIVGGGNAALIKCKTFIKKGCLVTVVAKDFNIAFKELENYNNLRIIKSEYEKKYIECNHIVIIATDLESLNLEIRKHCRENYRIYIDCSSPSEGLCVTPCQRNTENIFLGLNTLNGNPKISVYLSDKIKEYMNKYDEFTKFTSDIRNSIKCYDINKEIMNFMCSDDFFFFYEKGKAETVLKIFYPKEDIVK